VEERYFVYLLSAGDGKWGYIGQTKDMEQRLASHLYEIKHNKKPEWWRCAINEFPNPEEWELVEIAGPFSTRDEAMAEEERLQRWAWDEPGRLWENFGNIAGPNTQKKLSSASSGENNHNYGMSLPDDVKYKIAIAVSGENNANYGRPRAADVTAKISQTMTGVKKSAAHKTNCSIAKKGKNHPMYGRKQSALTRAKIRVKADAKRYTKAFFEWLSEPIT